jgi:hypothetical protein
MIHGVSGAPTSELPGSRLTAARCDGSMLDAIRSKAFHDDMRTGDAGTCLERRSPILFAADQLPFEIGVSTFCLLQPLMTVDGARLGGREDQFPNRARVWWIIRIGLDEITPGSLWTGRLQTASINDTDSPNKDCYQVVNDEIEPSSEDWVSIIEYDQCPPAIEAILDGQLDAPPTRPTKELLLRFRGQTAKLNAAMAANLEELGHGN